VPLLQCWCYLSISRKSDSTFFTTMSDMVGFCLTMASKPDGCAAAAADVLGSTSSSFSSSSDDDDEVDDEDERLTCDADDVDGCCCWPAPDVDCSGSLGSVRTFADVFGRPSPAAAIFAGEAPSSLLEQSRFAGILPTVTQLHTEHGPLPLIQPFRLVAACKGRSN